MMNLMESLFPAEFIRAFAWTLFHSLWQGALLALIAAAILLILRTHKPGIRYAILYFLMMLFPLFFAGTFLMVYNPGNTDVLFKSNTSFSQLQTDNNLMGDIEELSDIGTPHAWITYTVYLFENQAKWLVLLWLTGFFIFLLRFSGSMLYVYRLKNNRLFQVDERWNADLRRLSGKMGMHKPIKLAESALARIPMTIGYLKPIILLPLGTLSGVPPQQIDAILLHELAHILRKDFLLNIFQSVIELMFFYHPVTWWLSGLIRQEREHICDDLAVAVNQDHINYIKALTTMEELNAKSPLLASAMTGSKKKLLCRVKRLLCPVKLRKGFSEGIIAFIVLVGLIFTLSLNALSFIPNAYDLTGRESGEKIFNLLPFQSNNQTENNISDGEVHPRTEMSTLGITPDTIVSRSRSGKIVISVYTDSTIQLQQEQLNRMAESMEKQAQQFEEAREEHCIRVKTINEAKGNHDKECKVIVIRNSDSTENKKDSIIVISNGSVLSLKGGDLFDYEMHMPTDCPVPPDALDTIMFMNPGGCMKFDWIEGFEWSPEELQEHLKDIQIDIERDYRDAESNYHEMEREYRDHAKDIQRKEYIYFNDNRPPLPPPDPQMRSFSFESEAAPGERIIRQELIDDGLATPHKKYVIDMDSHGMYINGEKQSKDAYRKYKHLLESLEVTDLENDETYRLIF